MKNKITHLIVATTLLLLASATWAAELQWWTWQPTPEHPKYLITGPAQNNAFMNLFNYRRGALSDSELRTLLKEYFPQLQTGQIELFMPSEKPLVLLLANADEDFKRNPETISNFTHPFSKAGAEVYVLPVAFSIGLEPTQVPEAIEFLAKRFQLLVAMGGADVTPELYGQVKTFAVDYNKQRDLHEMKVIKEYLRSENGFLLGVCRGAQLTSVALGYSLVQDLAAQTCDIQDHTQGTHEIQLKPTSQNVLAKLTNSIGRAEINSLHHQAVVFIDHGPLELAATSLGGTTEALEFKNGRGLLLQFHPELFKNAFGPEMLERLLASLSNSKHLKCESTLKPKLTSSGKVQ